jgi:hypothetical protein
MGDGMEILGGFAVMMSILCFFMAVVLLITPFVVFAIKGKLDRTLEVLAGIEKRLGDMEARLSSLQNRQYTTAASPISLPPGSDDRSPA